MDEDLSHFNLIVKECIDSAGALGIDVTVFKDGNPIIMAFKSQQDLNLYRISGSIKEGQLVFYGTDINLVTCCRIDFALIPDDYA